MTVISHAKLKRGPNGEKDPNDFAKSGNFAALDEAIAEAQNRADAPDPQRFRLLTPDELASRPPAQYRIKQVLPAEGLAVIYGPPKSGKTFIVLDAAAAITEGREWFGYRTRPCQIVYVGLEGEGGLSQRWQAYRLVKGDTGKDRLRFVTAQLSLLLADDITDLANAIKAADADAGIVIIDTLNAASPGADENSSVDMGRIIAAAKRLQAALGGLVLLVHHAGKELSRGLRGHSSLSGAVDAIIEVSRDNNDNREWAVTRAKDGPESEPRPFRLDVVELGSDEDGDPITSCIVEPAEHRAGDIARHRKPPGGNQKIALEAIGEALKASTEYGKPGAPDFRPCVPYESAVDAAASRLPVEKKRARERARLAVQGLVSAGHLSFQEDWVWLP